MPAESRPDELLRPALTKLFDTYSLVSVESVKQGLALEAVYSVKAKEALDPGVVVETIGEVNGNMKVLYHIGAHTDPL